METTMPATEAKTLLQFLLDLLRDPQTQAQFDADPQATLTAAGLDGMCFADVRDALPLVMDHAPAAVAAKYDDDVRAASASAVAVVGEGHHHGHGEHHWIPGPVLPEHTPEVDKVIQQLQYVTNNYAYDSHDTNLETNLEQNIRANGDVTTTLNQPVASGAGAVAAGGDITSPVATGEGSAAGDGNMVNHDGTASFGAGNASSVGGSIGVDHGGAVSLQDTATGGADESATNFGSGAASSQAPATHTETPTTTVTATDNSQTDSNNADNSTHTNENSGAGDLDATGREASPLFAHTDAAHTADADTLAAAHDAQHHDVVTHA